MSMEAHMNGWDGMGSNWNLSAISAATCVKGKAPIFDRFRGSSPILEMVFAKELHKLHPNCFRGNPCNKASLSSTRQPRQPVLLIGSKYKAEAATKIMMQ